MDEALEARAREAQAILAEVMEALQQRRERRQTEVDERGAELGTRLGRAVRGMAEPLAPWARELPSSAIESRLTAEADRAAAGAAVTTL